MEKIIDWENTSPKQVEIPFKPARVLLQVCYIIDIQSLFVRFSEMLSMKGYNHFIVNLFLRILLGFLQLLILLACEML